MDWVRLVEDDCRRRIESCNRHEKAIKLLRVGRLG